MRRVVITGMGAITPLGNSVKEFWENIVAGKSSAGPITKFDAAKFKTQFACEVKGFNGGEYFEKKDLRKYDVFSQYAVAAAEEAVNDAGLNFAQLTAEERSDIGVIWASGNGGVNTFEEQVREFYRGDGIPRFSPFFVPKKIEDIAAGIISIRYQLYGPNYCTVSACASSNTAIINAFDTIRLGKAVMIIAGGSEAPITPSSIGGFNAAQALSKRNEDPQTASRPFDKDRDGFVLAEGAGALILEENDANGINGIREYTWKSALPYTLSFQMRLIEKIDRKLLRGIAFGELEGEGIWHFLEEDGITKVQYNWNVKTSKPWMNYFAFVLKPMFKLNHDIVMKWGAQGLAKKTGCKINQPLITS